MELVKVVKMKKKVITKSMVLKQGKEVFGNSSKFNIWLNTEIPAMGCKPITLWETKKGLEMIYNELGRIDHGIFC